MKLQELFPPQAFKDISGASPLAEKEIRHLTFDSRDVTEHSIFFALKGVKNDGHAFVADVLKKNPVLVVAELSEQGRLPEDGRIFYVKNSPPELERVARAFFQDPAEKLFAVGVTGTNGKTSTTYMIEAVLNSLGQPTGVLGTINHHLQEKVWESELTTPDAITLQKRLSEFLSHGARAAAFEISSHALSQNRVGAIAFDAMIFTNLTRDHLDYHSTMEEYFRAKETLFFELPDQVVTKKKNRPVAIVNVDDEYGPKIRLAQRADLWTYGQSKSDFQFKTLSSDFSGTQFELQHHDRKYNFLLPLVGAHNVYNAVAALAVGAAAQLRDDATSVDLKNVFRGLENFTGVPGRLQKVDDPKNQVHVFVDYAHTDDALRTVLKALNDVREAAGLKNRIITVFGCGGDRDKGKRPLMMAAAQEGSDFSLVTSDNPRTEAPQAIVDDILKGLVQNKSSKVKVEIDRRATIELALREARPGDVVLIAGKGHEDYQILGTTKYPFSDMQVAAEVLSGL